MKKKKNKKKATKKFKFNLPIGIIVGLVLNVLLFIAKLVINLELKKFLIIFIAFNVLYFGIYFIVKFLKKKNMPILKILLLLFFSFATICFIVLFLFIWWVINDAPEFKEENLYQKEVSIVYDKDGKVIGKLGAEKREIISYDDLPEVLIDAIVATEDSRFFQHNGFDLPRFIKATIGQLTGSSSAGGASTITMQVSKNAYTDTTSSGIAGIKRKFTDIYMSIFKIEKKYTKEEILEFYVNSYLMGGRIYGVEQACQTYFGKSAKDINLSEAATIAGLYQSPNKYQPTTKPEAATKRRNIVLSLMVRHGYITEEEKQMAEAITMEELTANGHKLVLEEYQDFIDTVVADVKEATGKDPYEVPMEIHTTMDARLQTVVNNLMTGKTYKWDNEKADAGVIILDTKTGAIVAVGAGRNRQVSGFNNATQTVKHIGSTAKPLYDYGPGIEFEGKNTYSPWTDEPTTYSGTSTVVNNWDGVYYGFLSSRDSLKLSRNIPALKTFKQLNKKNVINFVQGLGLSPETDGNSLHESHSIGGYDGESPLTLAASYAAFANGGYYTKPYSFTKVVYRETNEEYVNKSQKNQAMKDSTAYMVFDMLKTTATYVLGSDKVNNTRIGAKTGTSNYPDSINKKYGIYQSLAKDLWLVGMDGNYSMAVWYGYDKINEEYVKNGYYTVLGNTNNKKIFKTLMKDVFVKDGSVKQPNSVSAIKIETGLPEAYLANPSTPADLVKTELFVKGTEPTDTSGLYDKLDNVQNLTSSYSNGVVTLNWDELETTPNAISIDYWEEISKTIFTDENYRKAFVANQKSYINTKIGTVAYSIYEKQSDGDLIFIDTVTSNSATIHITSVANPITYVIKTTFSIHKKSESKGTEVTVSFGSASNIITSVLNGEEDVKLSLNETFTEPGVRVFENMIDVTDQATIRKTIKNSNDEIVTNIDTSSAGTYTVTYNITYNDYSKTHKRTIKIEE